MPQELLSIRGISAEPPSLSLVFQEIDTESSNRNGKDRLNVCGFEMVLAMICLRGSEILYRPPAGDEGTTRFLEAGDTGRGHFCIRCSDCALSMQETNQTYRWFQPRTPLQLEGS